MTDAVPAPSGPPDPVPGAGPVRKPRKVFILYGFGVGLAIVVLLGLFTSLGTNGGSSGGAPQQGSPVPAFSAANIGPTGSRKVTIPADGGSSGTPAVLLFFGNWCSDCHQELPPLAAAVHAQQAGHGSLARIRVIGVDSEDSPSSARSFIKSAGVKFPVAYDPNTTILSGDFYFEGDPNAVFVNGDGTIARIVRGDTLNPVNLAADERALLSHSG
jgi:thiol-disulfide isomerase/thioredoxin